MKKIAVFCGSSPGNDNNYAIAAESLGSTLVKNGIGLVFGGGAIGLMGIIARKMLKKGGEVVGVIPEALYKKQLALQELTDLRVVGLCLVAWEQLRKFLRFLPGLNWVSIPNHADF